jgi:hypothetical protein
MPSTCFSYSPDVLPGAANRGADRSAPPGVRRMPYTACFMYPATACFAFPPEGLPGPGNPGAAPPLLPGVRRVPLTCYSYPLSCFDYPGDLPPDAANRGAARRTPSALYRMPYGTCYRY